MSIEKRPMLPAIEVRHVISASPDAVFDAWVRPELISAWWGPEGFNTRVHELELRENGRFVFEMVAPNGEASFTAGCFRKIERPKRLVMEFTDHCNAQLPEGVAPQLVPSVATVDFLNQGEATEVVVTHAKLHPSYAELATFGWSEALQKLTRSLADAG